MQMKNRIIYGSIMIAILLLCVFLSPITRVLGFALAGCLCAYEYSHQMEKLNMFCSLHVMLLYLLVQAVFTILHVRPCCILRLFHRGCVSGHVLRGPPKARERKWCS